MTLGWCDDASPRQRTRPEAFRVVACVRDDLARRRITVALKGTAVVEWHSTPAALQSAIERSTSWISVAIIESGAADDPAPRAFSSWLRRHRPGVGIVAHCGAGSDQSVLSELAAAGVHDVMLAGVNDEGFVARLVVVAAGRQGAADLVMEALRSILPRRLLPFAEAAVRNPARNSVGALTRFLGIHRQTPNTWCRRENHLRPEELLVWCRLLLAAALLELSGRTLDAIALELDFASATSLRNQLKKYTGMTSTEIRDAGHRPLVDLFVGRVEQVRSGFGGGARRSRSARRDVAQLG